MYVVSIQTIYSVASTGFASTNILQAWERLLAAHMLASHFHQEFHPTIILRQTHKS